MTRTNGGYKMRVLLLLLSLLISIGCIMLAYMELVGEVAEFHYVLISTAISVVLAFLLGHFMFSAYRLRKNHKKILSEASDQEDLWHQAQNENIALRKKVNKLETDLKTARDEMALSRNWEETILLHPPQEEKSSSADETAKTTTDTFLADDLYHPTTSPIVNEEEALPLQTDPEKPPIAEDASADDKL